MRRLAAILAGLIACALAILPAAADEFRPAYLHIQQTGEESFEVLWRVPALDEQTTLSIQPVFPPGTEETSLRRPAFAAGATSLRWSVTVPGGLEGKEIVFDGKSRSRMEVLVRAERLDGSQQVDRILPTSDGFTYEGSPGRFEVATSYTVIGIEHILMGTDHLLFVLSLLLIVVSFRKLLTTITAFTIAHSITLVLATLGVVSVPGPPVEAIIALSIVFVASEILRARAGHPTLASRKPWVVAFSFGLLHGLGFAGALAEVGLPHNAVPVALLFFNVGVEIGQILFVTVVALGVWAFRHLFGEVRTLRHTPVAVTYVIGIIASFWVIERVAGF